jgi:transcription-repair coupling factor (superfamily II helicase)
MSNRPNPTPTERWGVLPGAALALALCTRAERHPAPLVVVTSDMRAALRLESELRFFAAGSALEVFIFPDWETLPYDHFSPHQDIVSQRLLALYHLGSLKQGVVIVPAVTLMQRLVPRAYVEGRTLLLKAGENCNLAVMRARLEAGGYRCVGQVLEHGEFAVRGALLDLFPMGSDTPYRIDLLDDEIESIRGFDPETQLSRERLDAIRLLPAREFPFDEAAITRFRQVWRTRFEGDPQKSVIYREVSRGVTPPGIEYYLPLFFETTASLFDYLPARSLIANPGTLLEVAASCWAQIGERHEQLRYDAERPLLPPDALYLEPDALTRHLADFERIELDAQTNADAAPPPQPAGLGLTGGMPPVVTLDARHDPPSAALASWLAAYEGRVLFCAESAGRRELLLDLLRSLGVQAQGFECWRDFLAAPARYGITLGLLESGFISSGPALRLIAESEIFGARPAQARRRRRGAREAEAILRDLSELSLGAPVVHEDHGVGRYLGLTRLTTGGIENEYLAIEYAGGDKLYVPVSSLHLIGRYSGAAPEDAPLHRLGSDQWQRARRRAAERARDVAAELLDVYARRAARAGHAFSIAPHEYSAFAAAFPFEETPDQQAAIENVLDDLAQGRPMDRVVCGDVGFGKTEVAMRAAFVAAQGGRQVALLAPTTLLAQQHYRNFADRFADWPLRIAELSRFTGKKAEHSALDGLADGSMDIVIGTHKLLGPEVRFKRLGLVILDEEHRFGVRQKERLKSLRAEVDVLVLTATPIPRTLNMSLAGLRDLSIIATPPAQRLAVKTFVHTWNGALIREACLREIARGGQIYFLHNEVQSIERAARELEQLVPEARIRIAHGQMRERELEQVMLDFYHRRFDLLLCTTIIESGIDLPNANTIIIQRADKLGLAQLHQLRGRVGRSHHRAYCYLIVPERGAMTADAVKRIEAIAALEDLGAGFALATHDLEIRGAGELLGEEQSGQIHEVGFALYNELLTRAVAALKSGKQPQLDLPPDHGPEVELGVAALIPEDYLGDVHERLILYKRIASAQDDADLDALQVEMIDRFGLLPEQTRTLFRITDLKLRATPLGVRRIEAGPQGGRIHFNPQPNLNAHELIAMIQQEPARYRLDGPERLRFTIPLPDAPARIKAVGELLTRITP